MSALSSPPIVFGPQHIEAQNVYVPPANLPPSAFLDVTDATRGALANTQPIEVSPQATFTGRIIDGVNGHFLYDRIQIEPYLLDLGNVVSAQTRQVRVWNANFYTSNVSAFEASNSEGITVGQPALVPYQLAPLQEVSYLFSVALEGPPTINSAYALTINGEVYTIQVTGSRVLLWPFSPNWKTPVIETLEWRTDINTARSGKEQRRKMRATARRRIEYSYALTRREAQRYDNIAWGWQNRAFALPLWQYKCRLAAEAAQGTKVLQVQDGDNSGFAADNFVILYVNADNFEVAVVDSVVGDTVTLKKELERTWPTSALVYPGMTAYIDGTLPTQRLTDNTLTGKVAFAGKAGLADPFLPTAGGYPLHAGREILLTRPDWAGGIDNPSDYAFDVLDFGIGNTFEGPTAVTPQLRKKFRWVLRDRARVKAFRSFLARREGRFNAVYLPSWHDDLTLVENLTPGSVSLSARDAQFFSLVGADPSRGDVLVRTRNGSAVRRIVSVGRTGGVVNLGLDQPIGFEAKIADIIAVHLVSLHRFAADAITIEWQTDGVAVIEAPFQLVPAE